MNLTVPDGKLKIGKPCIGLRGVVERTEREDGGTRALQASLIVACDDKLYGKISRCAISRYSSLGISIESGS